MEYRKSMEFRGDAAKGIEAARAILSANNFGIVEQTDAAIVLRGPGMMNTRQNAIVGATEIELSVDRGEVALRASLGGVLGMMCFVCIFPFALAGFLGCMFALTSGRSFVEAMRVPLLAVSPWVVLSPLMSIWIKRRTERALDNLLTNVAAIAESS